MYNILTLNNISGVGLRRFTDKYAVSAAGQKPDGILVRSASMHDTYMNPELAAIARAGAGVNNIPVKECTEKGIAVFNTPGANSNAVKEMVIASLLMSSRRIIDGIAWAENLKGNGADVPQLIEEGKSNFAGPELMGKNLGVIGLGAIGISVANVAKSLGMNVYGHDPYLSVQAALGLSRSVRYAPSIDDIYKNCDYITIHVPLTPHTQNMINYESLEKMRNHVRILNFSRGELVNNEDIINALKNKQINAYVTDFPSDDLLGIRGVTAIPHLGASTPESEDNCAVMAVDQLRNYLETGNIVNSVNLPNVQLPRSFNCTRLCLVHKNVPNTIGSFAAICGSMGLNIENMISKARGDYAYTILDVTGDMEKYDESVFLKEDCIVKIRKI